jgi:hypothetical protein
MISCLGFILRNKVSRMHSRNQSIEALNNFWAKLLGLVEWLRLAELYGIASIVAYIVSIIGAASMLYKCNKMIIIRTTSPFLLMVLSADGFGLECEECPLEHKVNVVDYVRKDHARSFKCRVEVRSEEQNHQNPETFSELASVLSEPSL